MTVAIKGILALLALLTGGNFIMTPALQRELGGRGIGTTTLPDLRDGEFEENWEHFNEKGMARKVAMIAGLALFMEWADGETCQSEVVLYNPDRKIVLVACDIKHLGLLDAHNQPFHVVNLFFGLDALESGFLKPYLFTIIPSKWNYTLNQLERGFQLTYNSAPHLNPFPPHTGTPPVIYGLPR